MNEVCAIASIFWTALSFLSIAPATSSGLNSKSAHDLAITNISAPSDCNHGDTIPITIRMANQGAHKEVFRVILTDEISGNKIASKEVTLAKGWKSGSEDVADVVFNGEENGIQEFGDGIRFRGDINGDGFDDILICAPRWNSSRGRVYLYYGGSSIDPSCPDVTFSGEDPNTNLGDYAGISGCDINMDGYDDVIMGAWGYNNYDGRVYVYYGGPTMDTQADMVFDGEIGKEGWFGLAVASADIDDDGYEDILVSAQNYNQGKGRVYLFWGGNPMDTSPDVIFEGEGFPGGKPIHPPGMGGGWETQGWFGRKIDAGGDINGDGYNDILVGARYAGDDFSGSAYLFFGGKKDQIDAVCDYVFPGEAPRDEMGSSVRVFDIDCDGLGDVLVGARFAAKYRGRV